MYYKPSKNLTAADVPILQNDNDSIHIELPMNSSARLASDGQNKVSNETDTSSVTNTTNPQREKVLAEVRELRQRAQQLRVEAVAEESALKQARYSLQSQRMKDSDDMIQNLFASLSNTGGIIPLNSSISHAIEMEIADKLRKERWSPEQVISVLERLQERQWQVQDQPPILTPSQAAVVNRQASAETTTSTSSSFQIGDTRNAAAPTTNAAANETEWNRLDGWMAMLVNAATILDDEFNEHTTKRQTNRQNNRQSSSSLINSRWTGRVAAALKSRRKEMLKAQDEELKRKIAANVNAVMKAGREAAGAAAAMPTATTTPNDIHEYTRQTLGLPKNDDNGNGDTTKTRKREMNVTKVLERVASVPVWVPTPLLPYLAESRATLRKEDVQLLKDKVLTGSRFFCTSSDAIPSAAIFRGNIRTPVGLVDTSTGNDSSNHTAVVFEEIQQRLAKHQGLAERIQLFFMEDPEWRPARDAARYPQPPPVVIAISSQVKPTETAMEKATSSVTGKRVTIALTLITTLSFSLSCYALNLSLFQSVVTQRDVVARLLPGILPLFLGVLAVQAFHEAAHSLVAKIRSIKLGRPTPLPSITLGTFGCITPLLSFPKDRTALFDLAFSGPVTGMILSMLMMWGGVHFTIHASEAALSKFPVVPIGLFKGSLLTSLMLSVWAPKFMMLPLAQPVPIHPLFLSGFVGLISSALNILPVFRLDGGRMIATLFGARVSGIASATVLLFMLSLTISGSSFIALTWGLLIVFLQRRTEVPVRDDVTQVDDVRMGAWVGAITAAVLALCPFPGGPGFL